MVKAEKIFLPDSFPEAKKVYNPKEDGVDRVDREKVFRRDTETTDNQVDRDTDCDPVHGDDTSIKEGISGSCDEACPNEVNSVGETGNPSKNTSFFEQFECLIGEGIRNE